MGTVLAFIPEEHFVDGPGMPENAQRIVGSRANIYRGWNTKPPTPEMEYFKSKILLAARGHAWTGGGMAVQHLRHYLGNSGRDYEADMERMLQETIVRERFEKLEEEAIGYARGMNLAVGAQFHSTRTAQMVPRDSKHGSAAQLRSRDTWFSVGTFAGWIEGRVLPRERLELTLRMLDIYDWDQDEFTLPIPGSLCSNMDSFLVELTVGRVLDKLEKHGTISHKQCKVTVEDDVMNDLHLMGLAKNYLTVGSHSKTVPLQ